MILRPFDYVTITVATIAVLYAVYHFWNKKNFPALARIFLALIKELGKDMADGKIDPEEAERLLMLCMNFIKAIIVKPDEELIEEESEEEIIEEPPELAK